MVPVMVEKEPEIGPSLGALDSICGYRELR